MANVKEVGNGKAKTDNFFKANTTRTNGTVMESISGPTAIFTKDSSKMIIEMELAK